MFGKTTYHVVEYYVLLFETILVEYSKKDKLSNLNILAFKKQQEVSCEMKRAYTFMRNFRRKGSRL